MTIAAESPRDNSSILSFLRDELALRPGRLGAIARIGACCTLVVAITMLYRIPEPAYAAYIVFLVSQDEAASSLLVGAVASLAVTLATVLTLLLFTIDASEPALRLPLMAGSAFLGMWLSRTIAIGPAAFLIGFLLVVEQTIIDDIPNLELLVRFILWLWVVVLLPVMVTVLVNLWVGQSASRLARKRALKIFEAVAGSLRREEYASLAAAQGETVKLIELRERAGLLDRDLRARNALDMSLIEALGELVALTRVLPLGVAGEVRSALAARCDACREVLEGSTASAIAAARISDEFLNRAGSSARPTIVAIECVLDRLAAGLAERDKPRTAPEAAARRPFLVPDAFTNPEHARFALKTTLAVMAAYIIYSGLDWSGIRTSVITCFFVALASVGETVHKLTLRLSGALIGGLLGGLCIVYVLPRMIDIGDLCLLIAAVSALAAWVATSSDRLAYGGMQIALAFFMGVLQDFGPATDLTVLRDRVVGILLGNIIMSLVFSAVWPVSAAAQSGTALAGAAASIAKLLRRRAPESEPGLYLAAAGAFEKARRLGSIAAFETGLLAARRPFGMFEWDRLEKLERIAAAAVVIADQPYDASAVARVRTYDQTASDWFAALAKAESTGAEIPAPPDRAPIEAEIASVASGAPPALTSSIEARGRLAEAIADFNRHAT